MTPLQKLIEELQSAVAVPMTTKTITVPDYKALHDKVVTDHVVICSCSRIVAMEFSDYSNTTDIAVMVTQVVSEVYRFQSVK